MRGHSFGSCAPAVRRSWVGEASLCLGREPKHREDKQLVQGHIGGKRWLPALVRLAPEMVNKERGSRRNIRHALQFIEQHVFCTYARGPSPLCTRLMDLPYIYEQKLKFNFVALGSL